MSSARSESTRAATCAGLVAAAILLAPAPARGDADVPVLPPGLHTRTLERPGQPVLTYAISVPAGYSRAARVPIVLALHFGVQGGPSLHVGRALLQSLVAPALADLGAVIVAPDVLDGGPWTTAANEAAVLALLDAAVRAYDADPRKIVVTGYSMGAAGAWHLAARHPDRFAAVVPMAGRPPAGPDGVRVPVFAVHSRRDQVAPFEATERRIGELRRAGHRVELAALDAPSHYETGAHADGLRRAVPWLRQLWK